MLKATRSPRFPLRSARSGWAFCFPLSIIRLMSAPVAPQKIMTHGDLMMKIPSPPPIPSYLHMLRAIKKLYHNGYKTTDFLCKYTRYDINS